MTASNTIIWRLLKPLTLPSSQSDILSFVLDDIYHISQITAATTAAAPRYFEFLYISD